MDKKDGEKDDTKDIVKSESEDVVYVDAHHDRIGTALKYAILGDVIGFGNAYTEFNSNIVFEDSTKTFIEDGSDYSTDLVLTFIAKGGCTTHPRKSWLVSDDTILTTANCLGIREYITEKTDLLTEIKKKYISIVSTSDKLHEFEISRYAGATTIKYLKKLHGGADWKEFEYDPKAGGNGGAMRSGIFGAIFWRESELLDLLKYTMNTTRMTHPNAIAILGAISVALFASYAMQMVEIRLWPFKMVELFETNIVDDLFDTIEPLNKTLFKRDKEIFLGKWMDYIENNFNQSSKSYIAKNAHKYPSIRSKYYYNFQSNKKVFYPGTSGDDCVIIAYDCVISCSRSFDTVLMYSALHSGDSDTTGTIACFLYGLRYGKNEIAEHMLSISGDDVQGYISIVDKIEADLISFSMSKIL